MVNFSVLLKATQVFTAARKALSVVGMAASCLPVTGGAAAWASMEACLPEFTRLLTLLTCILCQATLLLDRTAQPPALTAAAAALVCLRAAGNQAHQQARLASCQPSACGTCVQHTRRCQPVMPH